jgi:hypothetical protein
MLELLAVDTALYFLATLRTIDAEVMRSWPRPATKTGQVTLDDSSTLDASCQKKPYNASTMRYSTSVAMLALMAGCAQLEWLKPDTEPATRNEDLARCEQHARLTASRMSPSARALIPSVSVSPSGSASVQMPAPYAASDVALENDLLTSCMHAKGYRLVPAKSAGGH